MNETTAKVISHYIIRDSIFRKDLPTPYKNRKTAEGIVDKKNNEYGSYRYNVMPVLVGE